MKKIILLTLASSLFFLSYAQHQDSISSERGFNVFDRFGNTYTKEMSKSEAMTPSELICQAGYYSLYSDYTATGLSNAEEAVLCQVFTDLSNFIIPVNSGIPEIKIRVKDVTVSQNTLGSASSYYINYANNPEIVDPIPWAIINGGVDPFSNLIGYSLLSNYNYHGFVNINSDLNFHTNLTTASSTTGFHDLYSIVLHEVIHSLGFASTIGLYGPNGYNASGIYSRYDTYLETPNGQSLLSNGANCFENNFLSSFNPFFNNNQACTNTVMFNGPNNFEPVFTNANPNQTGSNLSHFISNCNGSPNYVMNSSLSAGITNRTLTQNEAYALCDIGYKTSATYGASAYPLSYQTNYSSCGSIIAGNNDFTFEDGTSLQTIASVPLNFNLSDLLYNDVNAESIECIEVLSGGVLTYSSLSGPFEYTPNPVATYQYLRYIPVDASGAKGNTTYVLIKINNVSLCNLPDQDVCNLVCGGDFQNPYMTLIAEELSDYTIWPLDQINSIDIYGTINKYVHMGWGAASKHEGFSLDLSETLVPGITYNLTLKLGKKNLIQTYVDIVTSQTKPCSSGTNAMYGPAYTCPDLSTYFGEIIVVNHEIESVDFMEYSFNFTVTEPANYITLFNSFNNSSNSATQRVLVDDVYIKHSEIYANAGEDVVICPGDLTILGGNPSVNGSSTYYWEGSDGSVYTTANPGVAPLTTTTYTLFVNSTNCDIDGSDQVVVSIENCCEVPPSALDYSNLNSSNIGSGIYNQDIYINEEFTVDADFTFNQCNIYLGENAKINVVDSYLNFRICTLQACSPSMWDGIYLDNQNESVLTWGTTISDAKNAVNAENNAVVFILGNSTFENNHIGLLLKHYSDAANVNVGGNTFIKTAALLPPFTYSIGIKAINVNNVQIGAAYSNGNSFSGLRFGMLLYDVDMYSLNNTVVNCYLGIVELLTPYIDGEYNTNFLDNQHLKVKDCTFKTCNYGIYASGFTSGLSGIHLNITDNNFSGCSNTAIKGRNLLGALVQNNNISSSDYGIYLSNVFSSSPYPYWNYQSLEIKNNTLTHIERYAIWTVNLGDYLDGWSTKVIDNTINYLPGTSFRTGINIENCDQIQVSHNTIVRSNEPYNPQELEQLNGIWIEESQNALVNGNSLRRLGHGIHGIGLLHETQFKCNQMLYNYHGFHFDIENQTLIADQGAADAPSDNAWQNSSLPNSMRIQGQFDEIFNPLPQWHYRNGSAVYNASYTSTILDYQPGATGSNYCSWSNPEPGPHPNPPKIPVLRIAEGDYTYPVYDEEYKHREKKKLYRTLRKNPSLYTNQTILENFVTQMDNSPLKNLLDVSEKMSLGEFEEALAENQQILSDKQFILNRKTVNHIYLNLLKNGGELSPADSLTLRSIALSTPYISGDAVYSARVLLDIDAQDYGISYRGDGSTLKADEAQIVNVYPNPVENQWHIDLLSPQSEPVYLQVYSLMGREVLRQELQGISSSVNTAPIAAGTYLYKIYSSSKLLKQGKFVKTAKH